MTAVVASLVALVLGPIIERMARRAPVVMAVLDGFVFVAIGGLVLLHILPHALEWSGWPAVAALLVGLIGPQLAERWMHRAARQAHLTALLLAMVGIVMHAFLDGVALSLSSRSAVAHSDGLALAVVLHRLPEGLAVWWLLGPVYGRIVASSALVVIGLATWAGFQQGGAGMEATVVRVGLFQALVGGALLHVVLDSPHPSVPRPRPGQLFVGQGVGAIAALALLGVFMWIEAGSHVHPSTHGHVDPRVVFITLVQESAPALLVAYLASGLVFTFLPQASVSWMRKGGAAQQSLRGLVFAVPIAVCSCGVIPLYRTLVRQGMPATAGMAFMVAAPELGLDAVLISIPLLGRPFAAARLGAAALVAFLVGWSVGRMAEKQRSPWGASSLAMVSPTAPADTGGTGLAGMFEVVDHTLPWILLGLGVAAVLEPVMTSDAFTRLPAGLDVPLFALLGMPSYVCASGATPLAAMLIHKGVSPGAALAFLLTGPATNLTTFGVLSDLHGRRVALAFGASIGAISVALGWLMNSMGLGIAGPGSDHHGHEVATTIQLVAITGLGLLMAISLFRQGPRGCVEQILSMQWIGPEKSRTPDSPSAPPPGGCADDHHGHHHH